MFTDKKDESNLVPFFAIYTNYFFLSLTFVITLL